MAYNPMAPVAAPQRPSRLFGAGGLLAMLRSGGFGQQGAQGAAQRAIGRAGEAGFFDPAGSDLIRRQVRAHALRTARNRVSRGGVLSRIMGLDPQQARAAQLGFEQGAGDDISGALNQSDLEQGLGNQEFFRDLFRQQIGFDQQRQLQREAAREARRAQGSTLGRIAGAAAGAFIPGLR